MANLEKMNEYCGRCPYGVLTTRPDRIIRGEVDSTNEVDKLHFNLREAEVLVCSLESVKKGQVRVPRQFFERCNWKDDNGDSLFITPTGLAKIKETERIWDSALGE